MHPSHISDADNVKFETRRDTGGGGGSRERVTDNRGEQSRQQHYHSASWIKHPEKMLSTVCSHWPSLQPITAQGCKVPLSYTQAQNMRERERESLLWCRDSFSEASLDLSCILWCSSCCCEYITVDKSQASLQWIGRMLYCSHGCCCTTTLLQLAEQEPCVEPWRRSRISCRWGERSRGRQHRVKGMQSGGGDVGCLFHICVEFWEAERLALKVWVTSVADQGREEPSRKITVGEVDGGRIQDDLG